MRLLKSQTREPSVNQIIRIGMDTSKHIFQLHGVDAAEQPVLRKRLRRKEVVAFGSIDPRCETVRGTHWPKKVAWLFGARVAETILASDPLRPHQQAGHMDASDPIRPEKLLRHGGRPHMGPGSRFAWPRRPGAKYTLIPPRA